ncbi:MAG: WecB/TagA/CpsF family glycosyltransferase [Lachnospiraceae bacterium]|nr:WecB/TagA/CpsF family glycosyltransferase [Lachnospiraceae bacterium]
MKAALNYIQKNLKSLNGQYICISNVHTTIMSYEDKDYCRIQNEAALALPDGGPIAFLCKRRGFPDAERVTGPDLMGEIFKCSKKYGYKHYFYGSKPETLKALEQKLKDQYQLNIAGMYAPPFREMTEEEDEEAVDRINRAQADFVWVALGAPKQERWMYMHQGRVHGLMIGIGAGADYFAGNIKRAPMWMQKSSLEWLYRLFQEPKRLFKRYLVTNTKFLWLIARGK